jgi:hypothetical protein
MMVELSFIATAHCTDFVPRITNEANLRCGEQFIVFDSLLTKSNFPTENKLQQINRSLSQDTIPNLDLTIYIFAAAAAFAAALA